MRLRGGAPGAAPRTPARTAVLVVISIVLLAGLIVDRTDRPQVQLEAAAVRALMPTAGPADALSASWYCAGATANAGGPAAASVILANRGAEDARGTVRAVPDQVTDPPPVPVPVTIGARSVVVVPLAQLTSAPHAAAVVEVDSGSVVAELAVGGQAPTAGEHGVTPCASSASRRWFFASGATAKDAALQLSLLNPFPEDAIVDLGFATDTGRAFPADFQGVVVPGRGLVVIDVGTRVRRREALSTEVLVRAGRLIAAQTLTRTLPGRAGVSLALGSPSLGTEWYFPDGLSGPGLGERYSIANPARREAKILIEATLAEGVAEPLERTVPARGRLDVVMNAETGVPPGVAHSVVVNSLNGVPVVVSREQEAAAPAPRVGRADTLGARRLARTWVFAAGGVSEVLDEWIVVHNPTKRAATVSLVGLAEGRELALENLQNIPIPAGRRQAFRISDHVKRSPLPIELRSSVPVVAERAIYNVGSPGLSATIGVPVGGRD